MLTSDTAVCCKNASDRKATKCDNTNYLPISFDRPIALEKQDPGVITDQYSLTTNVSESSSDEQTIRVPNVKHGTQTKGRVYSN